MAEQNLAAVGGATVDWCCGGEGGHFAVVALVRGEDSEGEFGAFS